MTVDTITYITAFSELLNRVPMLGWIETADTISAGSINDVSAFQDSLLGLGQYNNRYIYRYNLTGNDRVKKAADLNSPNDGKLNISGLAYVDQSDTAYAMLGVDPDLIMGWFIEAQRRQRFISNQALTRSDLDLDCEASGVLFWNGTSGGSSMNNVTLSKLTTSVFSGTQSLSIVGTGSGAYTRSSLLFHDAGQTIYVGVILNANAAACTLRLYDATNLQYFGQTRTIPPTNTFVYTWLQETVPSTPLRARNVQLEFAVANGARTIVDTCFGPYDGRLRYPLPAGLDEVYELPAVRPSHFSDPVQGFDSFYHAESRSFTGDWRPELPGRVGEFFTEVFRRDVNPCNIQFRDGFQMPNAPIWLSTSRQVSDHEPLTSETATTKQPLDLVVSHAICVMAEQMGDMYSSDSRWPRILARAQERVAAEVLMRPPQAFEPGSQNVRVGAPWGRGGMSRSGRRW